VAVDCRDGESPAGEVEAGFQFQPARFNRRALVVTLVLVGVLALSPAAGVLVWSWWTASHPMSTEVVTGAETVMEANEYLSQVGVWLPAGFKQLAVTRISDPTRTRDAGLVEFEADQPGVERFMGMSSYCQVDPAGVGGITGLDREYLLGRDIPDDAVLLRCRMDKYERANVVVMMGVSGGFNRVTVSTIYE
jgi:hypothetical protein